MEAILTSRPTPSSACFDIIKMYEGCKLNAYVDPGTGNLPITIGIGSTMYLNGSKIMMGDTITEEEAQALLEWEVDNKSKAVIIPAGLAQCKFDAIISFTYNLGVSAFQNSTLSKKIMNNPKDLSIRDEFMKWVNANGRPMPGLIKRRKAEADLYFSA